MTSRADIESAVRTMLVRRADDIDPTTLDLPDVAELDMLSLSAAGAPPLQRSSNRRLIGAVVAAAIVAMVVAVVVTTDNDEPQRMVNAGVPTTVPSELRSLPPSFDPQTAGSFYRGEGTREVVTLRYLGDRLHRDTTPDFRADVISQVDDVATMRWSLNSVVQFEISGYVLLRRDGGSWDVIAATTDGVDLSELVREGDRVHGAVRSSSQGAMSADVFDLDGKPVPAAPFPAGVPGAHYLYATAARGNAPELRIDITVPDQPVVVRVHMVGGSLFSVSEVRLDPSTGVTVPSEVEAAMAAENPTLAQQIARLESAYKNSPVDAPGGRPLLAAEYVFCEAPPSSWSIPRTEPARGTFASSFPLGQPLTEARIAEACAGSDAPDARMQLGAAFELCTTTMRGPVYGLAAAPTAPVTRPILIFGSSSCASAGYPDAAGGFLDSINALRNIEINLRAVPRDCPTEQEATAWIQKVTKQQLGQEWTAESPDQSAPPANGCYRPHLVDWDTRQVRLLASPR